MSEYFKLAADSDSTVNDLRKNLNTYIKETFMIEEASADSKTKTNANTQAFKEQENVESRKMYFCQIEPFNKSDDFSAFLSQLEAFILLNDIEDRKKGALLLTRLSSKVFAELQAAFAPEVLKDKTYEQLTEKLSEIYDPENNTCLRRFTFRQRKQKQSESLQEYILALRALARKCKFSSTEADEQIKDQLISGCIVNSCDMNC